LNFFQTVILVFLAADFLKRDRKMDSTEVFYARSMNNSDYILGKVMGIFTLFIGLNLLIAGVAAFIHFFFAPQNFYVQHYFQYFLYINLPNLIFTIGFTLLLMSLLRNQALSFVFMLAYLGVTVFYLTNKVHSIFDFPGFHIPTGFSDLAGLAVFPSFYWQRFAYLALGLAFIGFTIVLFKRLAQSRASQIVSLILAGIFLVLGVTGLVTYFFSFTRLDQIRNAQRERNQKYATTSIVKIDRVDLEVLPQGDLIAARAKVWFSNPNSTPIETILFSLNPGLKISQISRNAKELVFERDGQQFIVQSPLPAQASDSLEISYSGKIDENYLYLDVPDSTRNQAFTFWLYNVEKRHAFISDQLILLTPECNWYPVAGLPFGSTYPHSHRQNFASYRLQMTAPAGQTVISQGKLTTDSTAAGMVRFSFKTVKPLPGLSLIRGAYETRQIVVDSTRYALCTWKKHDYFVPLLNEMGDTLTAVIRQNRNELESYLNLSYPFDQVLLVETPIHFYSYARPWSLARESVQPEILFLPESGIFCEGAHIRQFFKFFGQRTQRSGQTFSPQEMQTQVVNRFISANITGLGAGGRFFMPGIGNTQFESKIIPNYFAKVNHIQADEMPIFNMALEAYIQNRLPEDSSPFGRMFSGLSDREKCNLELTHHSLAELLADPARVRLHANLIRFKGDYFFRQIEATVGKEKFEKFLNQFLTANQFKSLAIQEIVDAVNQAFALDIRQTLQTWYADSLLPGFEFSKFNLDKIIANERTRYQFKVVIENSSSRPGLVELKFQDRPRGPRFMPEEPINLGTRLVTLQPGERKEIGVVLDDAPRSLEINTLVSQNIPAIFTHRFNQELELNEKLRPFDGETKLPPPAPFGKPEILVDNEDPGFEILTTGKRSLLQKILNNSGTESEKYQGISPWQPPENWQATTNVNFFGKYIRSACAIKSGDGSQKVAWQALIPEPGQYEIYYYPGFAEEVRRFRGRPGQGPGDRRSREDEERGTLHFTVEHDDGADPVELNLNDALQDWNYLGVFYFSKGSARVLLSNESKGDLVYADAVKWVKK